jgi:hypothetical protein
VKCIRIEAHGDADVMKLVEVPDFSPGPGQALVRVRFAGINFMDVAHRRGRFAAVVFVVVAIPLLETTAEGGERTQSRRSQLTADGTKTPANSRVGQDDPAFETLDVSGGAIG